MKHILSLCLLLAAVLPASAASKAPLMATPDKGCATSFAIFADSDTYRHCQAAIEAWRDVLQEEGLGVYIVAAPWQHPQEVKEIILSLAKRKPALEGVCFVGNVPMVRVSGAQHMTTAFKMNERVYDRTESWVVSDRFYDDFDLCFDYVDQDTADTRIFYYRLNEKGAQRIDCDIYSSRIMPPAMLGNPYDLINQFLEKTVAAHREENRLDNVVFFAGSSYNSDCMTIWRQKSQAWKEYFPEAFCRASGHRILNFRYGADVKRDLYNELQRSEVDYFQFSEHGDWDTQYISALEGADGYREAITRLQDELIRYYLRYKGTDQEAEFLQEMRDSYHIDTTLFTPERIAKAVSHDSIERRVNMGLDEICALKSQPRVLIFNACYNGSFHCLPGYVAGCHLFNGGRSVVAQGNTVNVLQDKYEDECLGMLALGCRVGQWQKQFPYLESHLMGDPTFRFTPPVQESVTSRQVMDIKEQTLKALRRGKSNAAELKNIFDNSPSWQVRLEALHCLYSYADETCIQAVLKAFDDQYERIRREAAHIALRIGDPRFVAPLQKILDEADDSQRLQMAAKSALRVMNADSEANRETLAVIANTPQTERARENALRSLRNNPLHFGVEQVIAFVADETQPTELRVIAAEALGWYDASYRRDLIRRDLTPLLKQKTLPTDLRAEIVKTLKRLK